MTLSPSVQTTRHRLANHYLTKLQQANATIRRGQGNRDHWLNLMQQDWAQIKQWQAWSAAGKEQDVERARLCATFPVATADVLRVRQSPSEQLVWAREALQAAQKLGDTATEFLMLYQVAMLHLTVEALDEADHHAQIFLERALASDDLLSQGRAWYVLASAAFTRGVFDKAEEYFNKCLPLLEACNAVDEMPVIWRGLGRLAQFRGNYEQARTNYLKFLNAALTAGNEQSVLDANVALSGIYLALRDYEAAEAHAQRAVAIARNFGISRWFPPALISLAHAEKWQGKLESACAHYEEALAPARLVCAPSTVINGLYGLGQAQFRLGDYAATLANFAEALELAQTTRLPLRFSEVIHDMVYAHIALQDWDAARARLREALESAQKLGTPHFLTKTLAAAVTLWHSFGEYQQAAIWAGSLSKHTPYLHPSLFESIVYEQLEHKLGAERYRQSLEHGNALTLDDVIVEVSHLLGDSSE
jgi:tetratricopeptide (TPR) repeat protein